MIFSGLVYIEPSLWKGPKNENLSEHPVIRVCVCAQRKETHKKWKAPADELFGAARHSEHWSSAAGHNTLRTQMVRILPDVQQVKLSSALAKSPHFSITLALKCQMSKLKCTSPLSCFLTEVLYYFVRAGSVPHSQPREA